MHTPGPWHIQRGDSVVHVMAGKLAIVGTTTKTYYEKFDATDEANARLIAAAPEMLEALKEAIDVIKIWHGPSAWDIYNRASPEMKRLNAAISKAEGRT